MRAFRKPGKRGTIRLLTIVALLAMTTFIALLSGRCGPQDIEAAQTLKQAGDEMLDRAVKKMWDEDVPEFNLRSCYQAALATGNRQVNYDMAEIENGLDEVIALLEGARSDYEGIASLRGVDDYKAYAREMLTSLESIIAWARAYQGMFTLMDKVVRGAPEAADIEAVQEQINGLREDFSSLQGAAASHFDAAYRIDRERIRETNDSRDGRPTHVHLSWEHDPARSVTVHWETEKWLRGYRPCVEFGTSADELNGSAQGSSHIFFGSGVEQHEAELTGLLPDTTYFYRFGSPEYGWSETSSFRTAPDEKEDAFSFIVFGDTRSPSPTSDDFSGWEKVAHAAGAENRLFTVFLGDFLYLGFLEQMWPKWFELAAPLLEDSVMMSAHGNHEEYALGYFERFTLPHNERWYSFDVCGVHFVCLDTGLMDCVENPLLEEQLRWLEEDLASASQDCDLLVAFFHRPAYTTGKHGNQADILETWLPLMERYGVDLLLVSHSHDYERSYPLRGGEVSDRSPGPYVKGSGTIHLLQGCGGAPLEIPAGADWAASRASELSYTVVEISGSPRREVKVITKAVDGRVLDSFSISNP